MDKKKSTDRSKKKRMSDPDIIKAFEKAKPKLTDKQRKKRWQEFFKEQAKFIRSVKSMKGPRRPRYVHRGRVFI